MVTAVRFDFNEDVLRSIRAGDGRGGKASRKEVKMFVEVAVRAALRNLPPPKRRRPKASIVEKRASMAVRPAETVEEVRAVSKRIADVYAAQRRRLKGVTV